MTVINEEVFCEKLSCPLVVFWELTRKCNLSCRHCYTHSFQQGFQLEKQDLFKILKILCSKKIFSIGLGGGEPLIVKEVVEIASYAYDHGIDVNISTNGTPLTPKKAHALKNAGVSLIQVSIDGNEKTHDYIRGDRNYEKALRAISILHDEGMVTRVGFTVNRLNYTEIENVFEKTQKIGADWFIAFRYMSSGREGDELALSKEQLHQATSTLISLQSKHPQKVFFEKLLFFPYLIGDQYRSRKICNAGKSILNIKADGSITPCPHMSTPVVGNILRDDFDTIWNDTRITLDYAPSEKCRQCIYKESCNGGCKGASNQKLGRDPLCWI